MACIVIPESGSIKGEYPLFRARNRPADLYARSAIVAVDIRSGLQEVEPFMAGENRRLSDGEAGEMRTWVVAANDWSEAAQSVVGSATGLATASRELADRLSGNGNGSDVEFPLPEELRKLAERVEGDSVELRDRYLATAACIEEFSDFIE